jgi:hypothetical protein
MANTTAEMCRQWVSGPPVLAAGHHCVLTRACIVAASFMAEFFHTCAQGDKWMPFHPALGEHERYIIHRINSLDYLTQQQRYVPCMHARASRLCRRG